MNSPETIKKNIKDLSKYSNYIASLFLVYFIYMIKLFPFIRLPYNIEKIKWNRFN